MKIWTDEEINIYSEENYLPDSSVYYNKRKCPCNYIAGKDSVKLIQRKLNHIRLNGDAVSRTKFIDTMLLNFLLRYGPWQVRYHIYDGNYTLLPRTGKSYEFGELRGICSTSDESTMPMFIANMMRIVHDRLKNDSNVLHDVIIIHGTSEIWSKMDSKARDTVISGLIKIVGSSYDSVHLILSGMPANCLSDTIYDDITAGNTITLWDKDGAVNCQPVWYNSKKCKEIVSGNILPFGIKIHQNKLNKLRTIFPELRNEDAELRKSVIKEATAYCEKFNELSEPIKAKLKEMNCEVLLLGSAITSVGLMPERIYYTGARNVPIEQKVEEMSRMMHQSWDVNEKDACVAVNIPSSDSLAYIVDENAGASKPDIIEWW